MTREEQSAFLSGEYAEAIRYMDNAKEALQKAKKNDDGFYTDKKYVRAACGIAYSGLLIALDAWLAMKDVKDPKKNRRKSVDFYKTNLSLLDGKMADRFDTAYDVLHLLGYYDGKRDVAVIKRGFDVARELIDKIKPEIPVEVKESKANGIKRKINNILVSTAVMFG